MDRSAPDTTASLDDWLHWIEATHPNEIEMGLSRAADVASRASLGEISIPIITVAGTNGKGSTVAMLAAIYQAAGFTTGAYTSPHIIDFNERVVVGGKAVVDATLVAAFASIEAHRGDTALTYFEFSTLAAMRVFVDASVDVILLEVGLGGRLDTTNVWDTDCAIVTSIAIDHESWLGSDRQSIGLEKIGIGRRDVPLIMADQDPPRLVIEAAQASGMLVQRVSAESERRALSLSLPGSHQQTNAHAALMAVASLHDRLPVKLEVAIQAAAAVQVPGRFEQRNRQGVSVVLDVAHNPAAAASVVEAFNERFSGAPVVMIFGALNDKDISKVVSTLNSLVQHWHCVQLDGSRATPVNELCSLIETVGGSTTAHAQMAEAWSSASEEVLAYNSSHPSTEAVVLVAGSFLTLTALHEHWQNVSRIT